MQQQYFSYMFLAGGHSCGSMQQPNYPFILEYPIIILLSQQAYILQSPSDR